MTAGIPPRERFVTLLCVASFLACTLFLFGPLHLYFTNRVEFYSVPVEILPPLAAVCLTAAGVIMLACIALPPRLFKKAVAVAVMTGVLFWLQGNVCVWRVGVLNGREIPWSAHRVYGFVDGTLWAALLAVALVKSDHMYRIARRASAAFLLIQLIAVTVSAARAPKGMSSNDYTSDDALKFTFSNRQNVIILVIDTLQGDVFQEIVDGDDRYRDVFSGFTYFRNAVGGYPTTYPSVPLILTGRYYDNSVPIQEFIETAFSTNSLPRTLRTLGWRVTLPLSYYIYNSEDIASNLKKRPLAPFYEGNLGYAADLYDAALLRYAPYFAKKYVYANGRGRVKPFYASRVRAARAESAASPRGAASSNPDVEFIEEMARGAHASDAPDTFAYYHLVGLHPPFTLNENLGNEEMPYSRESYTRQARGMLKIAEEFVSTLRRIGVYDKSMVCIIADHGFGFPLPRSFCAEGGGVRGHRTVADDSIIGTGVPLILVKPFGAQGRMRVSDAPVTLADIPATVASALGVAHAFPGESVFQRSAKEPRERRFLFYDWEDKWYADYLPRMTEYVVRGFSGCAESWAPTGRRFSPPSPAAAPAVYTPGTEITFGESGTYRQYAGEGWSFPKGASTFTKGKSASLRIPLRPLRTPLMMRVSLWPFLPPGTGKAQRVGVYVNNHKVADWEAVPQQPEYSAFIPPDMLAGGALTVRFDLPDAVSPLDAGLSRDHRTLGILVRRMTLWALKPYDYGTRITFGAGGDSVPYEESGWSFPETGYTWTSGNRASLLIPLPPPASDLVLRAVLKPLRIAERVDAQRVYIGVNGKRAGEWRVGAEGEYRVEIPKSVIEGPTSLFSFDLPDAFSPPAKDGRTSPRLLGVRFYSVRLSRKEPPPLLK
ncbi:MAG: sulfatase-like hydrolase/transferase [Chlamydiota bacterium]